MTILVSVVGVVLWAFVIGAMSSSLASSKVQVSIGQSEWAVCGKASGLKTSLRIDVINESKEPLIIDAIQVSQERFWRESDRGKFELIRASNVPDEFVPSNSVAAPGESEELHVPAHTTKTFTLVHYVYVKPTDIQHAGKNRQIIASFHVTNVRKDGSAYDYWSNPISIVLPQGCEPE
jgi:hypothetical protein